MKTKHDLSTKLAGKLRQCQEDRSRLVSALKDANARYVDLRHRLGGELAISFERAHEEREVLLRSLGEL